MVAEKTAMDAFQLFRQSPFCHKPISVGMREILFLQQAPCELWIYQNNIFRVLFMKNQQIGRGILKNLIHQGTYQLFVEDHQITLLKEALQQNLKQASRTLSIGNGIKNACHQMSLLAVNIGQMYRDPTDDQALGLHYRSAKNLINFLSDNKNKTPHLYHQFEQKKYHYTRGHPLLSSLLLISFLNYLDYFSEQEIELLFLTNYFKDIGMALIPQEVFDLEKLNFSQRKMLNKHTHYSVTILKGRIPLAANYLSIIGNHHNRSLSRKTGTYPQSQRENTMDDCGFAEGIETIIIEMIDMVTAMVSPRPYRLEMSLFTALNKVKVSFTDNYQREFRHLVHFMQKFFDRTK